MIEKYKLVTSNFQTACEMLRTMLSTSAEIELNARPWKSKRSLPANAQVYVWYAHIAKLEGESAEYIRSFCKLMFGLPILLQDENYKDKISWTLNKIGFHNWNHEQQIKCMELFAVTSLFNTKQHNEYRDNMQAYYAKNGVILDYSHS